MTDLLKEIHDAKAEWKKAVEEKQDAEQMRQYLDADIETDRINRQWELLEKMAQELAAMQRGEVRIVGQPAVDPNALTVSDVIAAYRVTTHYTRERRSRRQLTVSD